MYQQIYLPLDNSPHSLRGVDLATALARQTGATLTGSHVYAAALHDRRFRQMEGGLPAPYRKEDKLVEQREIHDDLITRGLEIISDSFIDVFKARCAAAGVAAESRLLEGKNWQQLVADIGAGDYDLVVIGALGLGAVESSQVGSVCERVVRRVDRDVLIVRDPQERPDGAIVVAVDGSEQSFGGLQSALALARLLGKRVEAVAAFDPDFHYVAFNSISKVLSPAAASVFRFQEQEKLHEEIIDSGLAKIYQGHLEVARRIAADAGVELSTTLLSGKPFEQLLRYVREQQPALLVLGRIGVHSEAGMDLGSATENLLRLAPCDLLLSARCFTPPVEHVAETTMAWTDEAEARMARAPDFVRGMAHKVVIQWAAERGHTVITSDVIDACLGSVLPPAAMQAMHEAGAGGGGKCPFAGISTQPGDVVQKAFDGAMIHWEEGAMNRLQRIANETLREHARLRIEKMARRSGKFTITEDVVDAATQAVKEMLE